MAERKEVIPGFTSSELSDWKREAKTASNEFQRGWEAGMDEAAEFLSGDDDSSDGNGGNGNGGGEVSSRSSPVLRLATDSQKIIVISLTITVIVALVENAHKPKGQKGVPSSSIIVGGFVSGSLLLGMSYFLPEFASGFAIVAMVATVLERGEPFWNIIGNVTGTPIPSQGKDTNPKSQSPQSPQSPTSSGGNLPTGTLV